MSTVIHTINASSITSMSSTHRSHLCHQCQHQQCHHRHRSHHRHQCQHIHVINNIHQHQLINVIHHIIVIDHINVMSVIHRIIHASSNEITTSVSSSLSSCQTESRISADQHLYHISRYAFLKKASSMSWSSLPLELRSQIGQRSGAEGYTRTSIASRSNQQEYQRHPRFIVVDMIGGWSEARYVIGDPLSIPYLIHPAAIVGTRVAMILSQQPEPTQYPWGRESPYQLTRRVLPYSIRDPVPTADDISKRYAIDVSLDIREPLIGSLIGPSDVTEWKLIATMHRSLRVYETMWPTEIVSFLRYFGEEAKSLTQATDLLAQHARYIGVSKDKSSKEIVIVSDSEDDMDLHEFDENGVEMRSITSWETPRMILRHFRDFDLTFYI